MKRRKKPNAKKADENVITLCNACARDYFDSPDFYIKAILPGLSRKRVRSATGKVMTTPLRTSQGKNRSNTDNHGKHIF